MSKAQLLQNMRSPGVVLSLSVSALVVVFLVWSLLYKLDVASYAQGSVIPAGQVKKVQHLEGGIVKRILVNEGQSVAKGDVIAELEAIATSAEVGEIENKMNALNLTLARLDSQLFDRDFQIDPALEKAEPGLVSDARDQVQTFKSWFQATLDRFDSRLAQRQAEMKEAQVRIVGLKEKRSLIAKQVRISANMLKSQATSEYEHIQLEKELSATEAEISASDALIDRLKVATDEERANREIFIHEQRLDLRKEYENTVVEIKAIGERLRSSSDSNTRTVVRAPVSGTILTMFMKNRGAVVPPGGTIATLVPENEQLLLEAQLPVSEIGYVSVGTRARISMAGGSSGFNTIEGELVYISPDSVLDEKTGISHYLVRVRPNELEFLRNGISYPLTPGVQVMVALLTGERSVMDLLLDPFVGIAVYPLSER